MLQRQSFVFLGLGLITAIAGCTEIPATNPYDPGAPMELQRRATLSGAIVVTTAEDVEPQTLEGASLTLTGPTNPEENPRSTAEDGAFRYEDLLPGDYQLNVQHGGHIVRDLTFSLGAGDAREVRIVMQPLPTSGEDVTAGRIQGVIHKSGELALAEAEQDHSGITVEVVGAGLRTVTNRAGQFDLFLNAGTYTLELSTANYFTLETDEIEVAAEQTIVLEAPIALTPNPGSITGTILLEGQGESLGDTVVTLANTASTGTTGPDGAFVIDGVPAGTYTLRAARDGFETGQTTGVVVLGGRQTDAGSLTLEISRGQLRGTVTRVGEETHAGVNVQLLDTALSATTGDDGQYSLSGVPVGDYNVRLCTQGFEPRQTLVTVNANATTSVDAIELARQQITVTGSDTVETTNTYDYAVRFEAPAWVTGAKVWGSLADPEVDDFRPYAGEGQIAVQLSPGSGLKTVSLQLRGDDCQLSEIFEIAVLVDQEAPTQLAAIADAPTLANGTAVLSNPGGVGLEVTCFDDQTVANDITLSVRAGRDLVVYEGAYRPFIAIDLPANEGPGLLEVRCEDLAGNSGPNPAAVRYLLDLTAPNGTLRIGDRDPTNEPATVLFVDGRDNRGGSGLVEMSVGNGALDCATANYEPYRGEQPWALTAGDGSKQVSACLRDLAGNVGSIDSRVVLDTAPPRGGFEFLSGDYSRSNDVLVQLSREGEDATEYTFVSDPAECATARGYAPFVERPRPLRLEGEREHTVALCLRDAAGNIAATVRTVTVDTTRPTGHFSLNGGSRYTNAETVQVEITASADVREMKIAYGEAPDCRDPQGFLPVDLAPRLPLAADPRRIVDGDKTIHICIRDAAGHSVALRPKSIFLDRQPPVTGGPGRGIPAALRDGIAIELDERQGERAVINSRVARVTVLATDPAQPGAEASGLTHFKLTDQGDCLGGAWQEWPRGSQQPHTIDYVLPDGDYEEATVHVCFRDAAGNTSDGDGNDVESFDTIFVDTVPFVLTSVTLEGATAENGVAESGYTNTCQVAIDWSVTGAQPTQGGCVVSVTHQFQGRDFTASKLCGQPAGQVYSGRLLTILDGQDGRRCQAPDGEYTLSVKVTDDAGNQSNVEARVIELDGNDPELDGVLIAPSPESNRQGRSVYSNSRTISFTPRGARGGEEVRHTLLAGQQRCPEDLEDVNYSSTALGLPYSEQANADGLHTLCIALRDQAGRSSDIRTATVIIDTEAPEAPSTPGNNLRTVNASCAAIGLETDEEQGGRDPISGFWKYQMRTPLEDWRDVTADDLTARGKVKFDLQQDADNILQVRVVDQAGNHSVATNIPIEEVSSFLIPTDLTVKQVCNGGQYAILKQTKDRPTTYARPTCGHEGQVYFDDMPTVALLNLADRSVNDISPPRNLQNLSDDSCIQDNFDGAIIDAACSPTPGEPQLLVARPKLYFPVTCKAFCGPAFGASPGDPCPSETHEYFDQSSEDDGHSNAFCRLPVRDRRGNWINAIDCAEAGEACIDGQCKEVRCCTQCEGIAGYLNGEWPLGTNYGGVEFLVLPDPIEDPLGSYTLLGELGLDEDGAGDRIPLNSVDVLDWTGNLDEEDYDFRALATGTYMVASRDVDNGSNSRQFESRLRRIELNITPPEWSFDDPVVDSTGTSPLSVSIGDTTHNHMLGLSMYSLYSRYLKFTPGDRNNNGSWGVYRARVSNNSVTSVFGPLANAVTQDQDGSVSPHGSSVSVPYWTHIAQNDALGHGPTGSFLHVKKNGDAGANTHRAVACGANDTSCNAVSGRVGDSAPINARFVEASPGEVYWLDPDNPRVFYMSSSYGENPLRVRYPVDQDKPVLPSVAGDGGPGSAFAIYHTSGVTRGLVMVYRDDNTDGQCAE